MDGRKELKRLKVAFRTYLANAPREWYNRVLQSGNDNDTKKDSIPSSTMFSHTFFQNIYCSLNTSLFGVFDFIPPYILYTCRYA